ncbi:hypothetical protein [Escherichia phage P479]|uniref:Uncharacterized protein n=2 Tax=Gaprivervirus TaxID=1913654 RepID=A0A0A7HDA0_9CAUD|nr:gp52.1 conserved hypothetical predicted membrane protein [Escherichia phage vB_EcoM_VR7]YP_009210021.1 hypothetical protein AVV67_gp165 [Escherichia phage vB_EcoM_VR25]QMV33898.1 putative membrane protein [Escherichia phage DK-13]QWQ55866.1 hypothetical protein [Escherichia phage P479]UIS66213.1 hypothetical protein [Escherichia phage PSD2001]ADR32655.1 gp52.1 conserved hypothetical predicted membrane protein [Escherichia phage vB_EcoM_VR7]AIZ02623.1 hypothetical protein VR25_279 [Escheric
MIKKILGYSLALATLLVALYYGVMFALVQVVLFISDAIMAVHSLIW